MTNFTIRRDEWGHAAAIEQDGRTVLLIWAGAEVNEREIQGIVDRLNGKVEPI